MTATLEAPPPAPQPALADRRAPLRYDDRLVTPLPSDRLTGWVVTLLIGLFAGYLRLRELGKVLYSTDPNGGTSSGILTGSFSDKTSHCVRYYADLFDETYYHHDSLSLLHHGVELNCQNNGPGFVVHPPLGKWAIAGGIELFGNNPFGWRVAAAVAGTLAVVILTRVARRLFGSTLLGAFAGLLMALDGLEFVQSRVALLDIFVMFFELVALACLLLDREHGRRRLAERLDAGAPATFPGPRLGFRHWRLLTGVFLGAGLAVKWSGVYVIPGYAALAFAWDVGARRTAGIPAPVRAAIRKDWLGWVPSVTLVPVATYTATWAGWFLDSGTYAYDRHLNGRHGIVGTTQNWLAYQCEAYNFHKNLTDDSHKGGGVLIPVVNFCRDAATQHDPGKLHPYLSKPFSWFFLSRPVSYYYQSPPNGVAGCHAKACSKEVLAIGTPAIWWVTLPALLVVIGIWAARRDWRASMILVVFAFGFFPWVAYESRQMFLFYALPLLPVLILAITMVAGLILGRPDASDTRRLMGGLSIGVYLTLVAVNFFWLYPVLVGDTLPYGAWHARMWFPGWV